MALPGHASRLCLRQHCVSMLSSPGSFVTHFGKQVHWDGAKDDEAWVLVVGQGPGTLTRVEEAK